MSTGRDAGFWDRMAGKYAARAISDEAGYAHTLERCRALLRPEDRVVELGCGTGSTALVLAGAVDDYLATDFSAEMIALARDKQAAAPVDGLSFQVATAEELAGQASRVNAVLCFNYLHLLRDLPGTLRSIHGMLAEEGLFISKTPCLRDMTPLIRWLVLPVMRAVGMAPYVRSLGAEELSQHIADAGFEILAVEAHASRGKDGRPFIVARRK
ncbi:class I SAM-dependent methyltransferase [Stappia taiwanensis]|uniref:Class I SAM-dependent methyltransferase n=1 Tax=Stappia taiwanensis TaxID=992267 RepID=A0A838Y2I0_9HYPH|nr:class I SAM-dependent methyltransferase [Stappia taiwanensis]MBA4613394.1 class I SAM-dependent methyltransferase [Stappia taiwanensis]GGE82224.1 hypothetical protein GCM10007285_07270 [Stappia taiwanensis]